MSNRVVGLKFLGLGFVLVGRGAVALKLICLVIRADGLIGLENSTRSRRAANLNLNVLGCSKVTQYGESSRGFVQTVK